MTLIRRDTMSRAMFAVAENIARGEHCTMCGSSWSTKPPARYRTLVHRPGCEYVAYLDSFEDEA